MSENRYGDAPLGKSVEQIEHESANRVNSPVEGEVRRADETAVLPAVVNSNTTAVPAVLNPDALVEGGGGADDGTARPSRGTAEG